MTGLAETIAGLAARRKEWTELLHPEAGIKGQEPLSPDRLTETGDFGPNPGALRMLSYVPEQLGPEPALVVVLHGCGQTAAGYDQGSGWSYLAERYGFAVLFPEQQRENNPNTCFNWFQVQDTERDNGEVLSIRSMIERMIVEHSLDRRRIFVTGLSAGGAMASAMLATYPDVFSGGAVIAGLPYRAASDIPEAFHAMSQGRSLPARTWGDLVRSASPNRQTWPKVSIWHGSADTTVHPANAGEIIKQWADVHGLPEAPSVEDRIDGYPHRAWYDAAGEAVLEDYTITGMGHGTPLATGEGAERCGAAGAFFIEAGISSSHHIAEFWGLTKASPVERSGPSDEEQALSTGDVGSTVGDGRPAPLERNSDGHDASRRSGHPPMDLRAVVEQAFKAAGFLK